MPTANVDWMSVLAIANRGLVTPALAAKLGEAGVKPPEEVRLFLEEVQERNRERNRRMADDVLHDALRALNAGGVEPVLLKGAALWATQGFEPEFNRILSDIDLLVGPSEADQAVKLLEDAGFAVQARYPGAALHVIADLARSSDPGGIDLHQRPPGPPALAELRDLDRLCQPLEWRGARVRVPAPDLQIYFLVLHDQFHDGGYWRGGFDLRHLVDIAMLSRLSPPVKWDRLWALCGSGLVEHMTGAQLKAAEALAGAHIKDRAWLTSRHRWQYRRHRLQYELPVLMAPLAALAVLSEWGKLAEHWRQSRSGQSQPMEGSIGPNQRLQRVRQILSAGAGKI